jgi:endonuclease/exonuclease/phosphatase (EEP) superfamily protein YafD
MRRLFRWTPDLVLLTCLVPLGVRLLARDSVPALAVVTYATPVCLLAAAAFAAFVLARLVGRRGLATAAGALALVLGAWTLDENLSLHLGAAPGQHRALLWNIANGSHGWERVSERVRRHDPDLAAFIEVGANPVTRAAQLSAALPGRALYFWNDVLGLAVRGDILDARYESLGPGSHAGIAHVSLDGRRLTVVVVHPRSTPTAPRDEVFAKLERVLEPLRGEDLIVLGDFNTPADSVFFDPIRRDLRNAFETAGVGFAATWPMPFPVLALDQVWVSPAIQVRSCRISGSRASDHRLVAWSFD